MLIQLTTVLVQPALELRAATVTTETCKAKGALNLLTNYTVAGLLGSADVAAYLMEKERNMKTKLHAMRKTAREPML